jgi:pSer/pThr/pTyr-binding forkhead associated (FHA) protein
MRQRSGPGFATGQTNSAWSLAQRKRTRGSNRPLVEPDPTGLPAGSALIVLERGPNAGSRFLLDQPVTSAGRHPGSDIFLDDVTVSRRHAEFRWENDEFHVVDVGSLNNTYVNREPVDSAVLVNGDEVQIGKFRLTFLTKPKNHGGAGGTHHSGSTDR